jgi:hypothetical protein
MKAKHTFKYTHEDFGESFSPIEVTFEIPTGEVTISQMLYNFECYLKACGFVFDGHLVIEETAPYEDKTGWDEPYTSPTTKTPSYWDTQPSSICGSDKHNITAEDPKKFFPQHVSTTSSSLDSKWTKAEKKLKEWNESIAKLDAEVKKNKWVHGMCNPSSPDWKKK